MNRVAGMVLVLLAAMAGSALARTSNGNDFALFFSEAKSPAERKELTDDAMGRPHYFRYLRIISIREGTTNDRPYVAIVAVEPGSGMAVAFTVTKPGSLAKLEGDRSSMLADAIAVTGRIVGVDPDSKRIALRPVIVRHKDRLTPKTGKELFHELDPNAVYYSFTADRQAVQVPYKHRDLLESKARILGAQGTQAWADFLRRELAQRQQDSGK